MMPPYEVPEAREVEETTYFWKGEPAELAIVLQRELGVTEDLVPVTAKYMQLTSFYDETGNVQATFQDGNVIHALVTFYDANMATVTEPNDKAVNFVL